MQSYSENEIKNGKDGMIVMRKSRIQIFRKGESRMCSIEERALKLFERLSENQRKDVLTFAERIAYNNVLNCIKENPGISEIELFLHFPHVSTNIISDIVCSLEKDGKIICTEENDTYSLTVK